MLISYDWLKKYFISALPSPEKVSDALTFGVFEIEEMNQKENDTIFDIKILPDRSCYALSHKGIAYELSAILKLQKKDKTETKFEISETKSLEININSNLCRRYIGRRVENISIGNSPDWIKEKLEALGQRSINSVVDIANYVMLDMGEPIHAFDADKVKGAIVVRLAKEGETITTLDNREIKLDSNMLVIADDIGALAIAGIKGGKRAEVTKDTKNLILEAANFDPVSVRKTSTKVGIKNDSSKRFENNISQTLAIDGMNELTELIASNHSEVKIGKVVDVYPHKQEQVKITTTAEFIQKVLGVNIEKAEIISILERLEIKVEENGDELLLGIPQQRLDLTIPEDIVEEVGRIYGYDKIPATLLMPVKNSPLINKSFYWIEKIKDIFAQDNFSEVSTYALTNKGDLEIEKSIATDKNFLRTNLSENIEKVLKMNLHNAPLLGLDRIKVFEIGKVFPKSGEYTSLCVGIAQTKSFKGEKSNDEIKIVRDKMFEKLGVNLNIVCTIDDTGGLIMHGSKQIGIINNKDGILELDLTYLVSLLPDVSDVSLEVPKIESKFKPFSIYPFIVRDIAVFVPGENKETEILEIIKQHGGDLLIREDLFDVFSKEGKTSYAYRLVFQSFEKTLEDKEINEIMDKMTEALNSKEGWKVR